MVAKPLRTKPKSASAERCLRSLGATRDIATPDMETSNYSCEGRIVAWRFTKRQPGGRGDYWVLSLSGNCCFFISICLGRVAGNAVSTDCGYGRTDRKCAPSDVCDLVSGKRTAWRGSSHPHQL